MLREDIKKLVESKQKEYDELPKRLLQIKFVMAAPISTIDEIHLDGIIAYFSLLDLFGEEFYNMQAEHLFDPPCPFEKCSNGKHFWWNASFAMASYYREYVVRWKKRWDEEHDDLVDFGNRQQKIAHKHSFFKAFDMPMVIRNAQELLFCCRGNQEEIERLLSNCHFVGKKRSQGYGEIREIIISDTDTDWSCWHENGKPSRAIPITPEQMMDLAKKGEKIISVGMAYKPPYWHPDNKTFCYPMK